MATLADKQDFVTETAQLADFFTSKLGQLVINDTLWAGAPDYDALIVQQDLDDTPSFGGLTVSELGDATFALASLKNTIQSALPALLKLARLA